MSKAKYWNESWNPVWGCTPCSPGCDNCYARGLVESRFANNPMAPVHDFTPQWVEKQFNKSLRGSPVFVCNMSDLFHEVVTDEQINRVLERIRKTPGKIFLICTKRAERLKDFDFSGLHNLWVGVTAENQAMVGRRIPLLLQSNAENKWLSVEPLLDDALCLAPLGIIECKNCYDGPYLTSAGISSPCYMCDSKREITAIKWAVIGAESGKNARECNIKRIEIIAWHLTNNKIPVYIKQIHIDGNLVTDIDQFPKQLQIRETPWGENTIKKGK